MATTTVEIDQLATTEALVGSQLGIDCPEALAGWFERIYADARDSAGTIPWNREGANPAFIAWLNAEAPTIIRPGARVIVAACGLGHDVAELVRRGYDAVGFDVSPTCVRLAQETHPEIAERFCQADLLDPPIRFRGRFDLVVEIHTIQAAPPAMRTDLTHGLAWMLHRHGVLVAIARGRDATEPIEEVVGPPHPLTAAEMESLFAAEGLTPMRKIDDFYDDNDPPVRRLRGVFSVDHSRI
ncbi:MAG: methyltransferase domain-containing protein [Phycisphaeraceae bacterium]|nr:methyltransferase domain-containing protein [Phycisphaeraceae bacterium]MCB9847822.1 methyltransferase domain-containing protein [Phycisphaeraceae bacterium]